MGTSTAFRKFISGQYLFAGVIQSFAVLVPSVLLFHYGLLAKMIFLPLGALMVSQSDIAGPPNIRRNFLLICIATYISTGLLTGFLSEWAWALFFEILILGFFFSFIGLYGSRGKTLGTTALLVLIFNIDGSLNGQHYILSSIYLGIGGLWYLLLFFIIHKLRPYLILQQMIGENIIEIGHYLTLKSKFYTQHPDSDQLYRALMQSQVKIRDQQNKIRESLFLTREVIKETSQRSRKLMIIFLESVDLIERIMTSQQDYQMLHDYFDENEILHHFGTALKMDGNALTELGIAIQSGLPDRQDLHIQSQWDACKRIYVQLRKEKLNPDTIEPLIMLRQIINSMEDITQRINYLHEIHNANFVDTTQVREVTAPLTLNRFAPKDDYHPQYLKDNISFKSENFRHAVRMTTALLLGFSCLFFWPMGKVYWIMMTIVVILKPAFSISRKRNLNRIIGTLIGAALGLTFVLTIHNEQILFIITMLFMIMAFSMLQINYMIATMGITIYVIISFAMMAPSGQIEQLLLDRLSDTAAGSVIAGLVATFVLPAWEQDFVNSYIRKALEGNKKYFDTASALLTGSEISLQAFKMSRKEAFIDLANMSDNFQRMLSEPKKRQYEVKRYHQFVATSHMMTSYIAGLAYYTQDRMNYNHSVKLWKHYNAQISHEFQIVLDILDGKKASEWKDIPRELRLNKYLERLTALRKHEIITSGIDVKSSIGKELAIVQSIQNTYSLIHSLLLDEMKIITLMRSTSQKVN